MAFPFKLETFIITYMKRIGNTIIFQIWNLNLINESLIHYIILNKFSHHLFYRTNETMNVINTMDPSIIKLNENFEQRLKLL